MFKRKRKIKDVDTWNLDYNIARYTLPLLKRFKELKNGFPARLESMEEWDEILDKIIWSLEEIVNDEDGLQLTGYTEQDREIIKEYYNKKQEGLRLFGEYLCDLWW